MQPTNNDEWRLTMMINKNNYEIYFIDCYDGNLNRDQLAELEHFLDLNPDLREEFEAFENITIPVDDTIGFNAKENLKKTSVTGTEIIHAENHTEYFIAYHEGDLNPYEEQQMNSFLDNNPEFRKEFNLYGKLTLVPNANIGLEKKDALKKHPFIINRLVYYSTAIAAAILLLIGAYFMFWNNNEVPGSRDTVLISSLPVSTVTSVSYEESESEILVRKQQHSGMAALPESTIQERNSGMQIASLESLETKEITGLERDYQDILLPRIDAMIISFPDETLLANNDQKKNKSLLGRVISNAAMKIKLAFNQNANEITNNPAENLTWLNIVKTGVDGYNFFMDKEIEIVEEVDEEGELVGYALLGDNMNLTRKVKK